MDAVPNYKGADRLGNFLNDIDGWIDDIMKDVGPDRLKEIWHDVNLGIGANHLVTASDKLFKKISIAVSDSTRKYVRNEMADALKENECDAKFQLLCELQEKYKGRDQAAWRPPYDADEHMRSVRIKTKREQLERLNLLISIKKDNIDKLKNSIMEKTTNSGNISSHVDQINSSIKSCVKMSNRLDALDSLNNALAQNI